MKYRDYGCLLYSTVLYICIFSLDSHRGLSEPMNHSVTDAFALTDSGCEIDTGLNDVSLSRADVAFRSGHLETRAPSEPPAPNSQHSACCSAACVCVVLCLVCTRCLATTRQGGP